MEKIVCSLVTKGIGTERNSIMLIYWVRAIKLGESSNQES